jgi:general secretion pathway protein D
LEVKSGSNFWLVIVLICFLVAGCSAVQKVQQALTQSAPAEELQKPKAEEPKPADEAAEPKKTGSVEQIELPKFEKTQPPKPLPPPTPIDAKKLVHVDEPVLINVESMPLPDLIVHALGGMLKVNLYIDEEVKKMKDPITLRTGEPLPATRVFEIVLGVLESKNLYLEERAETLYVFKSRPGAQRPLEVRVGDEVPDSPANILQVVLLKYARPQELEPLLKDFYKTGVTIRVHPRDNALIFSGQASAIKSLVDMIQLFDVPYVVGKKAFIIKLVYWQPDEFVKQISQILDGIGINVAKTSRDPGIMFIPIRFLSSLLVLAPDDTSAKIVLEWKDRLDTAESAGTEEKAFTYVPEYAKAKDIVESIRKVYGISSPELPAAGPPPIQYPGMTPASRTTVIVSEAQQAQQAQQRGAPTRQTPPQPGVVSGLRIAADDRRNVVMVVSTPSNYKSILTLFKELDAPAKQVLIETTIAELTLTDDLSLGFEFFLKQKVKDGTLDISTLSNALVPLSPGGPVGGAGLTLQYIAAGEKLAAVINALQMQSKINILSRPRLMVLDNQEATIQVGSDVPIVTSQVSAPDISTGSPSILQNVQYRSTGVILRIKPTINSKGLLTLDISQEVSNAQSTTTSDIGSPTILTRRIQTSAVAGDGQTVVLGGIISENKTGGQTKVPWLGDLPVFGYLFRTDTTHKDRTELIILISPRILSSVDDATRVTEQMKRELWWLK